MIHAVLYTKPKCVQCKMTRRKMTALNFPYVDNYYGDCHEDNSIDVESSDEKKRNWSIEKIEKLKQKYHIKSLPFIKIVDDNNKVLDSWVGFRPDKISEWCSKIKWHLKINAAGGIVKNYVSRETDYLVIAPRQLDMFEEERKSKKQMAVEKINMNGGEIKIISEEKFLSMLK